MGQFLLICACGGVGAVPRIVLNTSIQRSWRKLFPLSTFIINVLASLLAGVAAAAYTYQTVNYYTYLLFVTGFLGGFSTFSTAVNEMVSLAKSKKLVMAAFYFLVTLVIPFGMVIVGWWIGSMGR